MRLVRCPFKSKVVLAPEPHFRWISPSRSFLFSPERRLRTPELLFQDKLLRKPQPHLQDRLPRPGDNNVIISAINADETFGAGGESGRLSGSPSGMSSGPGAW